MTVEGTKITYVYRDDGNYKKWGELHLSGIIAFAELEPCLFQIFSSDENLFLPEEIGVPCLNSECYDSRSASFHEIHAVETSDVDTPLMPTEEFLSRLRQSKERLKSIEGHFSLRSLFEQSSI